MKMKGVLVTWVLSYLTIKGLSYYSIQSSDHLQRRLEIGYELSDQRQHSCNHSSLQLLDQLSYFRALDECISSPTTRWTVDLPVQQALWQNQKVSDTNFPYKTSVWERDEHLLLTFVTIWRRNNIHPMKSLVRRIQGPVAKNKHKIEVQKFWGRIRLRCLYIEKSPPRPRHLLCRLLHVN